VDKIELKRRLKLLAVNSAKLCMKLPFNAPNKVYIDQVIRSSSSSAANYRAACGGKSTPDFINKLNMVEEELDETMFFYELLAEFNPSFKNNLRELYKEANELLAIMVSSIKTANSNLLKNVKPKIRNPKSETPNPKSNTNERSKTK
jgi:four helix bundle protein